MTRGTESAVQPPKKPMPPRLRLFIAVDPPGETAAHARRIIDGLRRAGIEASWVNPAQLHLTLHFLGNNVDESDLHAICLAMDRACRDIEPFEVEYGGVGVFPNPTNPRTIWLGVRKGTDDLIRLHDALAALLEPLGYQPEDRRYRPHATIGRVRRGKHADHAGAGGAVAGELEKFADRPAGGGGVAEVALYASRLERDGPVYQLLHAATLQGRRRATR
jgi:2'-5' RNA ligase